MQILPLRTRILAPGDDLARVIADAATLEPGDIIVISSKAVATVEGAGIDLGAMKPGKKAQEYARTTGRDAAFMQAVLEETKRLHGTVKGTCPGALLTEVRPQGLTVGTILTANAGLDQSNVAKGFAIGWPRDPVESMRKLRKELSAVAFAGKHDLHLSLLLTDSSCRPRRLGVTAFALVAAGIDPLLSERGHKDLFGRGLRITSEAVADQLATAANFLMGNADQATPAAIIRDHGLPRSNFLGWVPGIEAENDLFRGII